MEKYHTMDEENGISETPRERVDSSVLYDDEGDKAPSNNSRGKLQFQEDGSRGHQPLADRISGFTNDPDDRFSASSKKG